LRVRQPVTRGFDPRPSTLDPRPSTLDPRPSTLDPRPSTLDPRPSTLDPRPSGPRRHRRLRRRCSKRPRAELPDRVVAPAIEQIVITDRACVTPAGGNRAERATVALHLARRARVGERVPDCPFPQHHAKPFGSRPQPCVAPSEMPRSGKLLAVNIVCGDVEPVNVPLPNCCWKLSPVHCTSVLTCSTHVVLSWVTTRFTAVPNDAGIGNILSSGSGPRPAWPLSFLPQQST
jgi:hypothetical protein